MSLIIETIHYRRKEIVSGGHDKENVFERHYFLRLQQQFPEKWGGGRAHGPPALPVPTALQLKQCKYLRLPIL